MKNKNIQIAFAAISTVIAITGCSSESESNTEDDLDVQLIETPDTISDVHHAYFEFSAPNAMAYECNLDSSSFSLCESPLFYESVGEGEHFFQVRAIGFDGSVGYTSRFNWEVQDIFSVGHAELIPTNVTPEPVDENSWRGIIRINCDFAHSSYNDPIVFPGEEDRAHLHRFYGNTLVDHNTTMPSLYMTGESSCQGNTLNLSSYWLPALLAPKYNQETGEPMLNEDGTTVWQVVPAVVGNDEEAHEIFYYSAGVDDLESIQPVPPGLRIIAGDHSTMPGEEQDTSIVRWHCQSWESDDSSNPVFSSSIPECVAPDRLRMDIFFPSCWNGTDLDSSDHKSHMAYPVNDGGPEGTHCPDTHPIPVARPSYHYAFGITPDVYEPETQSSRGWKLASDMYEISTDTPGGLSLHGDWFNAWHPAVMEEMINNCIKQELDCHDGNLANGYRLSGTREGTHAEPEIVNGGLGY